MSQKSELFPGLCGICQERGRVLGDVLAGYARGELPALDAEGKGVVWLTTRCFKCTDGVSGMESLEVQVDAHLFGDVVISRLYAELVGWSCRGLEAEATGFDV